MKLTFKEKLITELALKEELDSSIEFLEKFLLANQETTINLILMYHNDILELETIINKLKSSNEVVLLWQVDILE